MRKLFRIGMYFFILNLLFGNSQTKEIESTQTLVLKVEKIDIEIRYKFGVFFCYKSIIV